MVDDKRKEKDLIHAEMARKANDEILVNNTTSKDYYVRWGGRYWEVPNVNKDIGHGRGKAVLPRYLAMKYCKEMTDKLILAKSKAKVEKARKEYSGNWWPGREEQIALRTNDRNLRKEYLKQLWGGLHRRFGLDEIPEDKSKSDLPKKAPVDQVLIEEIEKSKAEPRQAVNVEKPKPKKKKKAADKDKFAESIADK